MNSRTVRGSQADLGHSPQHDSDDRIAHALATVGGHLAIGRGGYTLYYDGGCRLSGYDVEPIKAACSTLR